MTDLDEFFALVRSTTPDDNDIYLCKCCGWSGSRQEASVVDDVAFCPDCGSPLHTATVVALQAELHRRLVILNRKARADQPHRSEQNEVLAIVERIKKHQRRS